MNNLLYLILLIMLPMQRMLLSDPDSTRAGKKGKIEIEDISENLNSLNIISLNTWGLPVSTNSKRHNNRFQAISTKINNPTYDIICLQECFHQELRDNIKQQLAHDYHMSDRLECSRKKMKGLLSLDCTGGLVTLSKYPILNESFIPFNNHKKPNFIEKLGKKGFLHTVINLGHKKINLINTHLYSGNNDKAEHNRLLQVQQIEQYLEEIEAQFPYDVVLIGDLNITHPASLKNNSKVKRSKVYDYIINTLQFADDLQVLTQDAYTIDPTCNKYSSEKDGGQQKLDYCLTKNIDGDGYDTSSKQVKSIFRNQDAISDHMGLFSTIRFKIENQLVLQDQP